MQQPPRPGGSRSASRAGGHVRTRPVPVCRLGPGWGRGLGHAVFQCQTQSRAVGRRLVTPRDLRRPSVGWAGRWQLPAAPESGGPGRARSLWKHLWQEPHCFEPLVPTQLPNSLSAWAGRSSGTPALTQPSPGSAPDAGTSRGGGGARHPASGGSGPDGGERLTKVTNVPSPRSPPRCPADPVGINWVPPGPLCSRSCWGG